jgi:two-component system LytT family sensor kinase
MNRLGPTFPLAPYSRPLVTHALTQGGRVRYDRSMLRNRRRLWFWLTAFFTCTGLLSFLHFYLDDLARAQTGTALTRFIEEMTSAYALLALMPIVLFVARRMVLNRGRWLPALGVAAGAAVLYSVLATTLRAVSRVVIFPIAGLGHYDYGNLLYRYPMEAASDVLTFAILAGFIYFIERLGRAKQIEIEAAHLQQRLEQAKLENLQLQLQPHFLFNTLNAISAMMYEDVGKADEMLAKLSDFLRSVLASSNVHEVPLEEELRMERMYVDIMRTRLERRLQISVHVDPGAEHARVPFMLLQPLLENSIRHGMADESGTLAIDVGIRRDDSATVSTVAADGRGFLVENARRDGHGLANVESRLAYMYNGASSFSIEARAGGGTLATMRFPFKEETVA